LKKWYLLMKIHSNEDCSRHFVEHLCCWSKGRILWLQHSNCLSTWSDSNYQSK
jgi:hypothetical protein